MKTAIIIGASGLVGKECLYQLLERTEYTRVIAVVRKPLAIKHHRLHQVFIDFDQPEIVQHEIVGDDVYCCLGTTIKIAGSQENFRKVDYTYPLALAKIALQNGASQFLLISALGADAKSSIFYSRVKGELEQSLFQLGYSAVKVFQPSLLLGHRKDFRVGESIAQSVMRVLGFVFLGPLLKYKAIPAITVAKAMIAGAFNGEFGNCFYPNNKLFAMGK
jgi:uncharacterized protein YbjT (DUF2867 family)